MCVAVIGGMDRLGRHYKSAATDAGFKLKIFSKSENNLDAKLRNVDALLIFTNKVSHGARKEAINAVKRSDIPIMQMHSCGVGTLKNCLNCLAKPDGEVDACLYQLTH